MKREINKNHEYQTVENHHTTKKVKIIEMDYLNGCIDIYPKGMIPFERSFASHPKAKYWSERNEKKPNEVYLGTGNKYWFDCDSCHHSFEIVLYRISSNVWCQYCSHTILCKDDDCITCYNNSFASHPKSKYWSDKNEENPRCVFKNSNTKYLFNCDKCNHENMIGLNNISTGGWCPYCSIPCKKYVTTIRVLLVMNIHFIAIIIVYFGQDKIKFIQEM